MAACCRGYRYRFTQFKAVFDLMEARAADGAGAVADVLPAADVDVRGLELYQRAFDERSVS